MRPVLVLGAFVLVLGALGCFSSPAPSQLPQPPPIVVHQNVPVPVPPVVRKLAAELHARADNTSIGQLAGRAAVALNVLAEVSDCVTLPPRVEVAPVVNPTANVVKPTTPGNVARAKAWWEHALDWIGAFTIGAGVIILVVHGVQFYYAPTTILTIWKHVALGVGFVIAGVFAVIYPWPLTYVILGLALVYGSLLYSRHKANVAAAPEVKPST